MQFDAEVFEWRGPAPFFWVALPPTAADEVREDAGHTSYGWGAIPVRVRLGATTWETSLLPRDGGYVLPLKAAVRRAEAVDDGDAVTVTMEVAPRHGRGADGAGPTT